MTVYNKYNLIATKYRTPLFKNLTTKIKIIQIKTLWSAFGVHLFEFILMSFWNNTINYVKCPVFKHAGQ